jgi:hypothetical protein
MLTLTAVALIASLVAPPATATPAPLGAPAAGQDTTGAPRPPDEARRLRAKAKGLEAEALRLRRSAATNEREAAQVRASAAQASSGARTLQAAAPGSRARVTPRSPW